MRLGHKVGGLVRAAAGFGVLAVTAAGLAATPVAASPGTGWVRLAHLSPNTPPVDVYLYSFGNPHAQLVLHHVAYGNVSPYEQVAAGDYTVSMRAAGAKPASPPVLSTGFSVAAGDAYTVAGMGPASGLRLQVMRDILRVPGGHTMIRVIQASLRQHVVKVTLGGRVLARTLAFASTTPYRPVRAGTNLVRVAGSSQSADLHVSLPADSTHTLVVLDGTGGLRITDLADAAGSQVQPTGGAATGLGGTAPRPAPSPLPWLALITAGTLLAGAGARWHRRSRPGRPRTP